MSNSITPENFGFFLQFVVPGFIILYFRAQFVAGRLPPIAESIAACAILSTLYQAALFPVSNILPEGYQGNTFFWVLTIFITPSLIGVVLGIIIRKEWLRKTFSKLHVNSVHPVATAWDWHFGRYTPGWVKVTLKNDVIWRGFLSKNSFLSTDPSERDMFISMVYSQKEDDTEWVNEGSSLWIAHGEIQSIEFINNQRKSDNVKTTK